MKKRLVALVVSFCLLISVFSGCTLMRVNEKRRAEAVVARVGSEIITRAEVASLFYTYYTSYGYSYYYTEDQVLEIVINNLINQKLILSAAKKVVIINNADKNEIWQKVREAIDSQLNTREKALREKLGIEIPDRLKDEEKEEITPYAEYESIILVPKTFEEDNTTEVVSGFEVPTDVYRLKAFNEYVAELVQGAKINGDNSNKEVIFEKKVQEIYKYYEEQAYIEKYQAYIETRIEITDTEVLEKFQTMINIAKQTYITKDFAEVAKDTSNEDFILYYAYENTTDDDTGDPIDNGYIRVQHLLLQFSDEVKVALSKLAGHSITEQEFRYHNGKWTPETDEEKNTAAKYLSTEEWDTYVAAREEYLSSLSTTYLDPTTGGKVKDEDGNELTITLAEVEAAINLAMQTISDNSEISVEDKPAFQAQEFKRLMFIYGSDPGMFKTGSISDTIGYTLPANSKEKTSYVGEFSNAVFELMEDKGVGAISDAITSDHGVHFIMILGKTEPGAVVEVDIAAMKETLVSLSSKQSIYEYVYGKLLAEKKSDHFSNHITTFKSENAKLVKQIMKSYKEILG